MKTASARTSFLVLLAAAAVVALAWVAPPAMADENTRGATSREADEGAAMPSRPQIGPQLPPPLPFPSRYVPGIDLDPGKPSGPEFRNPAPPPPPVLQRSFDYNSTPVPATERMSAGGWMAGNRGMASYTLPDHAEFGGDMEPPRSARPPHMPTFEVTPGWRDTEGRPINFINEGGRATSMGGKLDKILIAGGSKITEPGAATTALGLMRHWNRFANVWNAVVDGGFDKAGETAARELIKFYVNDYLSRRIAEGGVAWAGATIAGVTPAGLAGYALVMVAGYGMTEAFNTCINDWELLRDLARPRLRNAVQEGMQLYDSAGRIVKGWRSGGPTVRRVSGPGRPIAAPSSSAPRTSGASTGGGCAGGCPPATLGAP
jgi:hypothetical protein